MTSPSAECGAVTQGTTVTGPVPFHFEQLLQLPACVEYLHFQTACLLCNILRIVFHIRHVHRYDGKGGLLICPHVNAW